MAGRCFFSHHNSGNVADPALFDTLNKLETFVEANSL